jgi:hypothetical protein
MVSTCSVEPCELLCWFAATSSFPVASCFDGRGQRPKVDVFDYSRFCLWRAKLDSMRDTRGSGLHLVVLALPVAGNAGLGGTL